MPAWYVSFKSLAVPQDPLEIEERVAKRDHPELYQLLVDIFAERPVWLRSRLANVVNAGVSQRDLVSYVDCNCDFNLTSVLPGLAYYFIDGPWKNCWIRCGWDPRHLENRELASQLQRVEIRLSLANRLLNGYSEALEAAFSNAPNLQIFDGDHVVPIDTHYQLCDITFPAVAAFVGARENLKSRCSKQDGWLANGVIHRVRKMVKDRWFELVKITDEAFFHEITTSHTAIDADQSSTVGGTQQSQMDLQDMAFDSADDFDMLDDEEEYDLLD